MPDYRFGRIVRAPATPLSDSNDPMTRPDESAPSPDPLDETAAAPVEDLPKPRKKLGSRTRGTETLFRTSYRTHLDLSGLADAKANIMISMTSLILSIVIAGVGPAMDTNPWLVLPVSVLLGVCVVSLVFAILAARPRVGRRTITLDDVRANRSSLLFFGTFANLSTEEFEEGMVEMMQEGDRIYRNMIRDLHGLGSVLVKKYTMLRYSYTVFMVGLVASVVLFIFAFITAP